MTKEHKDAAILRALADGRVIQYRHTGIWYDYDSEDALVRLSRHELSDMVRVKPDTIQIGELEVARPMQVEPAIGTPFFYPHLGYASFSGRDVWTSNDADNRYLHHGLCFASDAEAQSAARAIFALFAPHGVPA